MRGDRTTAASVAQGSSIGLLRGDPVRRPSIADPVNRGINRYPENRHDETISIRV